MRRHCMEIIAYAYATISNAQTLHGNRCVCVRDDFECTESVRKSLRTRTRRLLFLTSCFRYLLYSSNTAFYSGQDNRGDAAPASFRLYNDLITDIDTDNGSSATGNTAPDLPPHVQQWISDATPAALTKVAALDFTRLKARKCCRLRCMHILPLDLVRACRLRYYSMSQMASRQWLATILENQPTGHKLFYLLSTVPTHFQPHKPLLTKQQKVCRKAFLRCHGASENKLSNCANTSTLQIGRQTGELAVWARAWISNYTEMVCSHHIGPCKSSRTRTQRLSGGRPLSSNHFRCICNAYIRTHNHSTSLRTRTQRFHLHTT